MPQGKEKKYFEGILNADDADFSIGQTEWVNSENVRYGTTDAGVIKTVESVGSTTMIDTPQPSVTFLYLGGATDEGNNRFCYFLKNTTGTEDKIMCFDYGRDELFTVLLSSQVTGGLNFDKDKLIHSAKVINGLLYWVESTVNEPRRIDINAGINLNQPATFPNSKTYTSPIEQSVIYWIRRQPGLPLEIAKDTDSLFLNNFIKNEAFLFSYYYDHINYELSVPSAKSVLANYDKTDDTFNDIVIKIPYAEKIAQDVQIVNVVAYYVNSNTYFTIHSWDKNIPSDLAQIQDHNNGITQLTYTFYNDFTGNALGVSFAEKQFDSVPIYAETEEGATFRAFMANVVAGYTTPTTTSLTSAFKIQNNAVLTGQWIKITYNSGANNHYFLDLGPTLGFFDSLIQFTPLPYPTTYSYTNMTFISLDTTSFAVYVASHYPNWIGGIQYPGFSATITDGPPPPDISGTTCFKSGASYQTSVEFLDHAGRKCGILTNATLRITNPDRSYDQIEYATGINWSLSNDNALNEIPVWAYYVSINLTKCLTTRFFLDARGKNITYATKDTDGTYLFVTAGYAANLNGIGIDITSLNSFGMGYLFAEGDLAKVYISGDSTVYNLSIVGQQDNFIVCQLQDLGTLGTSGSPKADFLFEIYTPYKPSASEPSYEVDQIFKILNPTTSAREYGTLAGTIEGDVTLLTRNDGSDDYLTENMSPNDKYYFNWNTDAGRPNFVDTIGQVVKQDSIAWSNTFIQGTKTNGLSSFDALDTTQISQENGFISKLQVTSKISDEQGIVMLAICQHETVSIYLGEVQQYGSTGQSANIVTSDQVIGTINTLKGSFGTSHAESVVEYRGKVFFWDDFNGRIIQYAGNGLFAVSDYKMTSFWKLFTDTFNSLTTGQIEDFGSRPFVFSQVDPRHDELIFSIPKLLEVPPKGYLPDYPSTIYPFDIWDGQSKTIVFKLGMGEIQPHWQGAYGFCADGFVSSGNNLYSSKFGHLYKHNSTTSFNNFYGVQDSSKMMFVSNQQPNIPKIYDNIGVESNMQPFLTYFYNEFPYLQASDLLDFDPNWGQKEGVYYADIYRNKLIPTAIGYDTNGLLSAEKLRGVTLKIMLQFNVTNTPLEFKYFIIGYSISRGHKQ